MFDVVVAVSFESFESFEVFCDSVFTVAESGFSGSDDGALHGVIVEWL